MRYPVRRGSGLFIQMKAFGDACLQIDSVTPSLFRYKPVKAKGVEAKGDYLMNKKLLLSLLLGSAAIGASAETVAWVNIGNTGLRNNIYVRGEYSELRYMTIEFHPDSVYNYMVDPATDF